MADVGELGLLGLLDIDQQGPGRPDAGGHGFAAETGQAGGAEMIGQGEAGRVFFKVHLRSAGDAEAGQQGLQHVEESGQPVPLRFGEQQFRRFHPGDFVYHRVEITGNKVQFADEKIAGGDIEETEAGHALFSGAAGQGKGADVTVAFVIEQLFLGGDARGDHPDDLALDNTLGLFRVLGLFTDRHPETGLDQLAQVAGNCVKRDAAHGDLVFVIPAAAGGERDAEHLGGRQRIVKEHLVKIAHAVEENGILVLFLDFQVLPKHGGYFHWFIHGRLHLRAIPGNRAATARRCA